MLNQKLKFALPLVIVFAVLLVALPRYERWGYEYSKGSHWKYETLTAQFDFPILKTQAQLRQERGNYVFTPYYHVDAEVASSSLRKAETCNYGRFEAAKPVVVKSIGDIYSRGVLSDAGVMIGDRTASPSDVFYIQRDKRASKYPVSEVYTESSARKHLVSDVSAALPYVNADSLLVALGLFDLIQVDLIFDEQFTKLAGQSNVVVSPTLGYVRAGQIIVSNGEMITAEIEQVLRSYEHEYNAAVGYSDNGVLIWVGNLVLALVLVLLIVLAIWVGNKKIFRYYNCYLYILVLFMIAALSALVVSTYFPRFIILVPFTLTALYLTSFFKPKLIFPVYTVSLVPLLILAESGVMLFTMFLVAGSVSMMLFPRFSKGVRQFIMAFITFAVLAAVYAAFTLLGLSGSANIFYDIAFLFVGSMLTVAGYPVIYLFEKIFNLVSDTRLQELTDTGHPLVRELEQKAPGTFQHSLQVMNMATAVARAIGGNEFLIRAGALYHDIGKIANPLCFVENESLAIHEGESKYHDDLTPLQSAQDIMKHVTDGVELAHKYHLPQRVIDFILSHHGTTFASYFYDKYLREGGDPDKMHEFKYPGMKPKSAEQVILMLCDSLEAASRTLRDYSPESISALVEKIVDGKSNDGQFTEAEISLKEIGIVKDVLKSYLAQIYHERIIYPKKFKFKKPIK